MTKPIGVAVVGCGAISELHLNAIQQIPETQLIFVCDKDQAKARETANSYHCQYITDYTELLSRAEVEVIHILTPHFLHTPMTLAALAHGKHVILEKPIGISIQECQALNQAAAKSDKSLNVVLQNRYNPISTYLKQVVDSSRYGELKAIKGIVTWHRSDTYYAASDWRGKWATEGGGLLINQAIHTLDLMQWLGGEVTAVKGHIDNYNHASIEVEDTGCATLYYANGAIGNFYGTNNHGINSNVELELVFEEATLTQINEELWMSTPDQHKELVVTHQMTSGDKGYWGKGHHQCIETAYQQILEGNSPPISVKDALAVHELIFGIYQSSKTKKIYEMEGKLL